MREIKFRAWNKTEKRMGEFLVHHSGFGLNELFASESDDYDFMQYTGLKDKNGVEIYEGDIVLDGDDIKRVVEYAAPHFTLHKVEFIKGRHEANTNDYWIDNKNFSTPFAYEEVIGNIYENPELLK